LPGVELIGCHVDSFWSAYAGRPTIYGIFHCGSTRCMVCRLAA